MKQESCIRSHIRILKFFFIVWPVVLDVEVIGGHESTFLNLCKDISIYDTILRVLEQSYSKAYVFPIGTYLRLVPSEVERCKLKYCAWDLLPQNCLEDVRSSNACIVFDTILEVLFLPGHDICEELNAIYSEVTRLGLDPSAIYIPTSNMSATKVHSEFIKSQEDTSRSINIICANFLIMYYLEEYQKSASLTYLYKRMEDEKEVFWENWIQRETQKFIFSLNRKAKEHRLAVLLFLASQNKLDQSNVSMLSEENSMSESAIQLLSNKYAIDISPDQIDRFIKSLPLKLSSNDGFAKGWDAAWSIPDLNLVNDCLLTVACESLCSNGDSLFLTEKTMKPILFLSPFVVVGDPFTLQELQKLGFKTFSPFIDESYDTIIDSRLRILEIMRQIKIIGDLDPSHRKSFKQSCSSIVQHNINHFLQQRYKNKFIALLVQDFRITIKVNV